MGRQLNIIYETYLRNFHYWQLSLNKIRFIALQFFCLLLKIIPTYYSMIMIFFVSLYSK